MAFGIDMWIFYFFVRKIIHSFANFASFLSSYTFCVDCGSIVHIIFDGAHSIFGASINCSGRIESMDRGIWMRHTYNLWGGT
ncbi:unnamed protein product [Camellia sinensis]